MNLGRTPLDACQGSRSGCPRPQALVQNMVIATLIWLAPLACARAADVGPTVWTLDTGGIAGQDESYLVGALQGLVNRDHPRLYLNHASPQCAGAGNVFAHFLQERKGIVFGVLPTLQEAVTRFAATTGADGKKLIKGLVVYDPGHGRSYLHWIAGNIAAQEGLLPVTPGIMAGETSLLSGRDRWSDDIAMHGWDDMFAGATATPHGLEIRGSDDQFRCGKLGSYRHKWIQLDLARTPKLEITIAALSPGGSWGLAVDLGSTIRTDLNPTGTVVAANRTDTGTFVFDLAASGKFDPTAGRADLHLCVTTAKATVTVSRVRLLDASGNAQPVSPSLPLTRDWLAGLPIVHDLRDQTAYPDLDTEEHACAWSIAHQLPLCDRHGAFFAPEWTLYALDEAIAKRAYIFHQDLTPYAQPFPHLDEILARLTPPALISGWLKDESYYIHKLGSYGHRQAWLCENLSFWKHVPADPGKHLPQTRQVAEMERICYVNFSGASGDVVLQPAGMMSHYWFDPARGTVPVTWGLNPCLAQLAPAMVEYFARTATPLDSFWAGPSGSGYTSPSAMSPAQLAAFANVTRSDMAQLGMSPAVDLWDSVPGVHFDDINRHFTQIADSQFPPIGLFTPCVWNDEHNPLNQWMDDGTPVFFPDHSLFSLWEEPSSGIDCSSQQAMAKAIAARIVSVADKHADELPYFLTLNIRWSPTVYRMVMDLLPRGRFRVVGMPDFIALAQEAGALAVRPLVTGVGSNGTLAVDIRLHNLSGTTGAAGAIRWNLPVGWSAQEEQWAHGPVAKGTTLSHRLLLTAPRFAERGVAQVSFSDSRVPAVTRSLRLSTHPDGSLLSDGSSQTGWHASGGAALAVRDGRVVITPATVVQDSWRQKAPESNGRATFALGKMDFARLPILEVHLPANFSKTCIGVSNGDRHVQLAETSAPGVFTFDLAKMTKWTGVTDAVLTIDPGVTWGFHVELGPIALFTMPSSSATR